jgi:hypothetical protein
MNVYAEIFFLVHHIHGKKKIRKKKGTGFSCYACGLNMAVIHLSCIHLYRKMSLGEEDCPIP